MLRQFRNLLCAFLCGVLTTLPVYGQTVSSTPSGTTAPTGQTITAVGDSLLWQGNYSNPRGPIPSFYKTQYQVGTDASSVLGWLQAFSQGAFTQNFALYGYTGPKYGIDHFYLMTQGVGCPANTALTFTPSAPATISTGTITINATGAVVGSGTQFAFEFAAGSQITANSETHTVISVTDATHMTTDTWAGNTSGLSYTQPASPFTVTTDANGNLAFGQKIQEPSYAMGGGYNSQPTYTMTGGSCVTSNPNFVAAATGSGTYDVGGDQLAGINQRIQYDLCASPNKPDWVVADGGTNDLVLYSLSESSIVANVAQEVALLHGCNIRVVLMGIPPRGTSGNGLTAAQEEARIRINNASQKLAQQSQANTPGSIPTIYLDLDHYWTDPTQSGSSAGIPLAAMMQSDGLHPAAEGAWYAGLALWSLLHSYAPPLIYQPDSQGDLYSASNNPAGNLWGTSGLFVGTGGTVTSTCTGSAATGWTIAQVGSTTSTCTASIETTRTDGLQGRRQVIAISGSSLSNNEIIQAKNNIASNVSIGDTVYCSLQVDVSNVSNALFIGLEVVDSETTGPGNVGTALFQGPGTVTAYLPPDATVAKLNDYQYLPDAGKTSAGSYRITLQTAPVTMGSNFNGTMQVLFQVLGNASSQSWSTTVKLGNGACRKIAT